MANKLSNPTISVGIVASKVIDFNLLNEYTIHGKEYSGKGQAIINKRTIELYIDKQHVATQPEINVKANYINKCQFELKDVTIGVDFHWEQKENQVFQGDIKFSIIEDKIQVINILPIENYLISVISSEMSASSSLNLLKAHAVISRSWLLAQIQKQNKITEAPSNYITEKNTNNEHIKWYDREDHEHFHVCADDHCQRYQGITRAQNRNVKMAVNETAGLILEYNGNICDARFSKCCGGVSELFENCWEPIPHPYLVKVVDKAEKGYEVDLTLESNAQPFINEKPDAFCNTNDEKVLSQVLNSYDQSAKDFYRWQISYTQQELSSLVKTRSGIDFGDIIDLIPIKRGTSGRLIKLKIIGTKKTLTIGKELEIRKWLSESHLYSSAITISKTEIKNKITFIINGAGWGHGVGLCQIGAAVMGEKGYNYKKILMHYYKNAEINKLY